MGGRLWTDEEITYLEESWGSVSITTMAKKLNRSEGAIIYKSKYLKLGGFIDAGELISLNKLLAALGQGNSLSWVRQKYINNGLPVISKCVSKRRVLKVSIDEFWKWAEKNKSLLNFARFEKGVLGVEPDWVEEKRRADCSNPSKHNSNRPWSNSDDILLISKLKSYRYTYKDLAVEFNRTEAAIKRRIYDLNIPYRPIPLDKTIKWSKDETNKMIELYKKGYDTYAIAKTLDKSHLTISDRLRAQGW